MLRSISCSLVTDWMWGSVGRFKQSMLKTSRDTTCCVTVSACVKKKKNTKIWKWKKNTKLIFIFASLRSSVSTGTKTQWWDSIDWKGTYSTKQTLSRFWFLWRVCPRLYCHLNNFLGIFLLCNHTRIIDPSTPYGHKHKVSVTSYTKNGRSMQFDYHLKGKACEEHSSAELLLFHYY